MVRARRGIQSVPRRTRPDHFGENGDDASAPSFRHLGEARKFHLPEDRRAGTGRGHRRGRFKNNLTAFQFIDLTAQEVLGALAQAQSHNVVGARVHDYLHAVAAQKAGVDEVLSRNQNDFSGLTGKIPVVWP